MSERTIQKPKETLLDLPEDEPLPGELLDAQVQKAQEQLVQLKRQQEQIEKQKRELEELSRRQEQLQQGKVEMVEKFTRSLVVLERETYDAEKRVEQLKAVHESFRQHLDYIEAINPKAWDSDEINKELNKALSAVDDARAEYARSRAVLNADSPEEVLEQPAQGDFQLQYNAPQQDFLYWLKSGLAFTLPLLLVGLAILIVLYMLANK
jgi:chromosome segregation ATPase